MTERGGTQAAADHAAKLGYLSVRIDRKFVADLEAMYKAAAARVIAAPQSSARQNHLILATHIYETAMKRVSEGWSRQQIEDELQASRVRHRLRGLKLE